MDTHGRHLLICMDNSGYEASLERLKLYVSLPDETADHRGLVRVIDESGEDYLYSKERFLAADLGEATHRRVLEAA